MHSGAAIWKARRLQSPVSCGSRLKGERTKVAKLQHKRTSRSCAFSLAFAPASQSSAIHTPGDVESPGLRPHVNASPTRQLVSVVPEVFLPGRNPAYWLPNLNPAPGNLSVATLSAAATLFTPFAPRYPFSLPPPSCPSLSLPLSNGQGRHAAIAAVASGLSLAPLPPPLPPALLPLLLPPPSPGLRETFAVFPWHP